MSDLYKSNPNDLAAGLLTDVYTCPPSRTARISVVFANRTAVATTIRLAVAPDGAADAVGRADARAADVAVGERRGPGPAGRGGALTMAQPVRNSPKKAPDKALEKAPVVEEPQLRLSWILG